MVRLFLLAALCLSGPVFAQTLTLPGLSVEKPPAAPACENIPYSQTNCVRVLACIGSDGLYFDGQALGWDQGKVIGKLSSGARCQGDWESGGFMGTGSSRLGCDDGTSAKVIYYTQDNETGTVTGRGMDNSARAIIVWTGTLVLDYLTPKGKIGAELPCGPTPIPIS